VVGYLFGVQKDNETFIHGYNINGDFSVETLEAEFKEALDLLPGGKAIVNVTLLLHV